MPTLWHCAAFAPLTSRSASCLSTFDAAIWPASCAPAAAAAPPAHLLQRRRPTQNSSDRRSGERRHRSYLIFLFRMKNYGTTNTLFVCLTTCDLQMVYPLPSLLLLAGMPSIVVCCSARFVRLYVCRKSVNRRVALFNTCIQYSFRIC